jgi:hypothetical protein
METIESFIYEAYHWKSNGVENITYICVPATLVIMNGEHIKKSQFIFWN